MSATRKLSVLAALVLALAAPSAALSQQKLKFAHVYETSEPYHAAALWAAGEIAKRTANRYTMDVFPASSLGNETQINQSLSLGTVDVIYTGQAFAARTYPPLGIGGAPYMHVPRLRPLEKILREPGAPGPRRGLLQEGR